jgi:hypothetical protein
LKKGIKKMRYTKKDHGIMVKRINRLKGITGEVTYKTTGAIVIEYSYGDQRVCQIEGPGGGQSNLSMRGTRHEVGMYLAGMLEALEQVAREKED